MSGIWPPLPPVARLPSDRWRPSALAPVRLQGPDRKTGRLLLPVILRHHDMPLLRGIDVDPQIAILMRDGPHELLAVHVVDIDILFIIVQDDIAGCLLPYEDPVRKLVGRGPTKP
jgi:hypothetical protein